MIYFLKLFGATVSEKIVENLISKQKHLQLAIKLKLIQESPRLKEDFKKMELLIKFLHSPLSLMRLCRLYLVNKNLLQDSMAKNLPEYLKTFLLYKFL